MIEIKTSKGGFAEIYADGLRFSLVKRVAPEMYEAYHASTCCKDFFTDIFWSERMGKPTSIHGFSWAPGTLSLNEPWYYMALEHSKDISALEIRLQWFMNEFDKAYGFPLTQVKGVGSKLLIAFANEWTRRPVLVSMVTAIMRVGLMADAPDVKDAFAQLLRAGNPFGQYDKLEFNKQGVVPLILKSLETKTAPHPNQTFEQYKEAYACHHAGGLIAFTTGRATS
jgi:hypothetical protein